MEQSSVIPKTIKVSSRDKLYHKSLLLTLVLNMPVTQYDPNFDEYKKRSSDIHVYVDRSSYLISRMQL